MKSKSCSSPNEDLLDRTLPENLRAIRDFIDRDSEAYAADFIDQIVLSADPLTQFPKMGRVVPEAQAPNIRELLHQNYRLIYRLASGRIEVLAVVHSARDFTRSSTAPWNMGE
jgi:toxin ParE1/3/4